MEFCSCYHECIEKAFDATRASWKDKKVYRCWGTKEQEICSCGGDETKCNFYEQKREEALEKIKRESENHGTWLETDDSGKKTAVPYCSNCLHTALYDGHGQIIKSPFCWNCGVKMTNKGV